MPCNAYTIAVASGEPMKIGRYRWPSSSRSSTIGWFVGTSTRTPTSDRRITAPPFGRRNATTGLPCPTATRSAACTQVGARGTVAGTARRRTPSGRSRTTVRSASTTKGRLRYRSSVVQAVAEHVHVADLDAAIAHVERARCAGPVGRAACTRRQRRGARSSSWRQQVRERQPGVDDVLDEHDVAAGDVDVEILEDPHPTRVGRVPRDRDEVDLDVDVGDRAREVGEEDQRALQHADEHARRRDDRVLISRAEARDVVARDRASIDAGSGGASTSARGACVGHSPNDSRTA